jgi:DNA-directed RNA polymerase alpha subunit
MANEILLSKLPTRIKNLLSYEGINSINDLASLTENDLSRMPDIGNKFINHIKEYLACMGFKLKDNS